MQVQKTHPFRKFLRMVPKALCVLLMSSHLGHATFKNAGEKYCQQKQWEKALEYYKLASAKKNYDWEIPFNLGIAHYNLKQWDEAIAAFKDSLGRCRKLEKQESIFYNLGNALYRKGETLPESEPKELEAKIALWEESLKDYASALDLKKSNDTQHNHDWVKEQLERLKKKQTSQQDNSKNEENKKEGKPQDQSNKEDRPENSKDSSSAKNEPKNNEQENESKPSDEKKELPKNLQQQEMQNILNASQKEEQKLPLLLLESTNETTKKDW